MGTCVDSSAELWEIRLVNVQSVRGFRLIVTGYEQEAQGLAKIP